MSVSGLSTLAVIALCIGWISIVVRLVLDFRGRKSVGPGGRWMGAGLLLMFGALIVMQLANALGWSPSPLLIDVTGLVLAAGFALVIVGTVARFRSRLAAKKPQT